MATRDLHGDCSMLEDKEKRGHYMEDSIQEKNICLFDTNVFMEKKRSSIPQSVREDIITTTRVNVKL